MIYVCVCCAIVHYSTGVRRLNKACTLLTQHGVCISAVYTNFALFTRLPRIVIQVAMPKTA